MSLCPAMLVVRRCVMWKYFITGFLVSWLTGGFTNIVMGGMHLRHGPIILETIYALPGGFLAGFVGYLVDRKFATSLLHKISLIILTIILSIVLSISCQILFIRLDLVRCLVSRPDDRWFCQ